MHLLTMTTCDYFLSKQVKSIDHESVYINDMLMSYISLLPCCDHIVFYVCVYVCLSMSESLCM